MAVLKQHVASGETASTKQFIDQIVSTKQLDVQIKSPDYRRLAQQLQRAEIEALKRSIERDDGDFGGRPTDAIVRPPTGKAPVVAAPGESITELFEAYATENPRDVRINTLNQSRVLIDIFSQFVGRRFPVANISKKEVREWKTALKEFPVKASETALFKDLDFRQIVTANRLHKRRCISAKTINKYLAALGSFARWLVTQGFLENNPTTGMFTKIDKDTQKVFPYGVSQLQTIFHSPLFLGCESDTQASKPGKLQIRDHRFWLPILSLFSGARLGELAQLLTADIQKRNDHWLLRLTKEGDAEKHLKTKGSERYVPVHPELITLGLIRHNTNMKMSGEKWLFPEICADARNDRAGKYSRFYGRYIKQIGVKIDKTLNFHSFRHGFSDALRNAGYLDEQFKFLLGHTQNNVTGRYGVIQEGDIATRVELVNSVEYKGLDLSHLVNSVE